MTAPTLLIVATCDTKSDEARFLRERIETGGGHAIIMDVGVLGTPPFTADIASSQVAAAAGATLAELAALGDENSAMARMAVGAADTVRRLHAAGEIDGLIALGGTMGTDLALDVAAALPLGVPKVVVSTVSFSHLIPPQRIAPDLTMLLWAGGLYGVNSVCRTVLAQAAGAALGACAARISVEPRPLVGMTSLGKSCLSYMVRLKPALEARGFELAVFHTTGMGGAAFEALAAQGRFVAVLDLSLQEISNDTHGSVVSAGPQRLEAAGRAGIPQIVAPGAVDMIDLPAWQPLPARFAGRPYHAHNRLIASVTADGSERRATARRIADKLATARGRCALLLPQAGVQEWDRPGQPLHQPDDHQAFLTEMCEALRPPVELQRIAAHINDVAFSDAVLLLFDTWVADGTISRRASA